MKNLSDDQLELYRSDNELKNHVLDIIGENYFPSERIQFFDDMFCPSRQIRLSKTNIHTQKAYELFKYEIWEEWSKSYSRRLKKRTLNKDLLCFISSKSNSIYSVDEFEKYVTWFAFRQIARELDKEITGSQGHTNLFGEPIED